MLSSHFVSANERVLLSSPALLSPAELVLDCFDSDFELPLDVESSVCFAEDFGVESSTPCSMASFSSSVSTTLNNYKVND